MTLPQYARCCATNWAETLPVYVIATRLGHRPLVVAKHYLHTRDAYVKVATRRMAVLTREASPEADLEQR